MKQNTQKLLIWLYSSNHLATSGHSTSSRFAGNSYLTTNYSTNYKQLKLILSDLTPGGRRSLVHYLVKKHLLNIERVGKSVAISMTTHGQNALKVQFPVFSPAMQEWQGQWSALIFLDGPKGDPHFRYLRRLLLDNHAFAFSRGVYFYPGEFSSQVINICKEMYVGAVNIVKINGWEFGDERSLVSKNYMLLDLIEVYSGISSEIKVLLKQKDEQKRLTNKFRVQIFSVFDRLFDILCQDPGFIHYYYPQIPTAIKLLNQLHLLVDS